MKRAIVLIVIGLALLTAGLVVFSGRDTAPTTASATPKPVITSKADLERSQREVRDTKVDTDSDLKQNEQDAQGL